MLKDKSKLLEELHWMNTKSYLLVWFLANLVCVLIVLWVGVLPVGWMGFILGGVSCLFIALIQRRMARKLADKIMAAHREDYTVHVDLSLGKK